MSRLWGPTTGGMAHQRVAGTSMSTYGALIAWLALWPSGCVLSQQPQVVYIVIHSSSKTTRNEFSLPRYDPSASATAPARTALRDRLFVLRLGPVLFCDCSIGMCTVLRL
jgi:hypothetical protein